MKKLLNGIGAGSLFTLRVLAIMFKPPFEMEMIIRHLMEIGAQSLLLICASGFALGAVTSFHTRSTLVAFGATAMIPAVQADAFFVELGPLVTGLLIAGRVGSGIGAILANMRASEQIDAIESLSVDSFSFLVIPRVIACAISLPILTLFLDVSGLLGGYVSEYTSSRIPLQLYVNHAFTDLGWANFIPPTLKTAVFGFIIGTVSSFFGYTIDEGAAGVGRASTNSVVASSLIIILADVILIRCIFFLFPESAI